MDNVSNVISPPGRDGQVRERVDENDRDLGQQQNRQHHAVDVDPKNAERADDGPRDQGEDPPAPLDAEPVRESGAAAAPMMPYSPT